MPDWKEIIENIQHEINNVPEGQHLPYSPYDKYRKQYINELSEYTGRNVIVYYSAWLQKSNVKDTIINDVDKNGFMTNIHNMDVSKGLDLILHTPGGDIAATESIVDYLHQKFDCNIRAFIPQLAMSAGTMMACACKEIFMGKQSSLGPIDPQITFPNIGTVPAYAILNEIETATREIKEEPAKQFVWAQIISKYNPTFIGECQNAINWSQEITKKWLQKCMFADDNSEQTKDKINKIVDKLSNHDLTKSHSRHLSNEYCKNLGLKVTALENDQKLQDLVLSIHHACMITFYGTTALKIIENQNDKVFLLKANQ